LLRLLAAAVAATAAAAAATAAGATAVTAAAVVSHSICAALAMGFCAVQICPGHVSALSHAQGERSAYAHISIHIRTQAYVISVAASSRII
jgi:hypothetical protein